MGLPLALWTGSAVRPYGGGGGTSSVSVPGANSNGHLTSHANFTEWAQRAMQKSSLGFGNKLLPAALC